MVVGIGTDILSVERMRCCLNSPSFMQRTFTDKEMLAGASHQDPDGYFARLFAGKEAVFKCFGTSPDALTSPRDIEILGGDDNQPTVGLSGSLAALADSRGVGCALLSLSSDKEYAVAFAALIGETNDDT